MPLNDRSRIDFSRCFSISYNSYFPRLLLPNWVQDYYSACENYREAHLFVRHSLVQAIPR